MGARTLALVGVLSALPAHRLTAALQCPDGSPPPCRPQPTRSAPAPPPNSVAVLYFDNLSSDTTDAYLADGLSEETMDRLAAVERLQVKSRHTVRRYKGREVQDLSAVGRGLRVGYLVEGTIRRAGARVRVSVRLVRAVDGLLMWSSSYDRAAADVLDLQEEIATRVARSIAGRLLPAERDSLAARPTRSAPAYSHFARANYYLGQRTPGTVAQAIEEYRAALRLDPGFSRAVARIAYAYALFLDWGWPHPELTAESLLVRGSVAADQAIRLDSTASDAWMARAYILSQDHPTDLAAVQHAFQRATALDPENAEAHHQSGYILAALGADSAAAAAYHRALAIEPNRPITLMELGALQMSGRRFAEARRWMDSAITADPGFAFGHAFRAVTFLHLGDTSRARADAETATRLGAGYPAEVVLAGLEAAAGDTARGRARIARVLREQVDSLHPNREVGLWVAASLVALGEAERALDLLERVRPRGWGLWFYLRQPGLDAVRSHPRFQRLVEESRPK